MHNHYSRTGPSYLVEIMNKGIFILFSCRFAALSIEVQQSLEEKILISLIMPDIIGWLGIT